MRETIQTERLLLRRFQPGDEGDCFAFLSDRETCHLGGGYEPFTKMDGEYAEIMERFRAEENRRMIVERRENKVIGVLHWFPDERRCVKTMEIGYIISPACRRRGYAAEAVKALMDALVQDEGVGMITASAAGRNVPSRAMLHKLGFTWEGRIHKGFRLPEEGLVDLESYYWERPCVGGECGKKGEIPSQEDLTEAKRQIDSTLHKLREAIQTLEGKENASRYRSQLTLAKNRVKAFEIANHLIEQQLE